MCYARRAQTQTANLTPALLALALAVPPSPVRGATATAANGQVGDARIAGTAPIPGADVAGPRPHFGFTQASVVAQQSAPQAGLQQLQNIPVGAWSTFG